MQEIPRNRTWNRTRPCGPAQLFDAVVLPAPPKRKTHPALVIHWQGTSQWSLRPLSSNLLSLRLRDQNVITPFDFQWLHPRNVKCPVCTTSGRYEQMHSSAEALPASSISCEKTLFLHSSPLVPGRAMFAGRTLGMLNYLPLPDCHRCRIQRPFSLPYFPDANHRRFNDAMSEDVDVSSDIPFIFTLEKAVRLPFHFWKVPPKSKQSRNRWEVRREVHFRFLLRSELGLNVLYDLKGNRI